jgi:hypothetical protein
VELEKVAVALRPRGGWEALDLGFQMARQWWRPIWTTWLAFYLPVAGLALWMLPKPIHAVLLLWWLKPVFDRVVLHVASRAVFGEPQGVRDTIRAAREWLRPGLLTAMTFYRFDLARSFALPVWQLEHQRGAEGRRRRRALASRMRGYAVWLTVVCVHLEWISMIALAGVIHMLQPSAGELGAQDDVAMGFWEAMAGWTLSDAGYYIAAVSFIEPFYVTAGFALYLNRRAILEGWDIELALRRLDRRLRLGARAAVLAVLLLAAFAWFVPPPALAEEKSAQDEIRAVLDSPEFSQYQEVTRWRYLGAEKERRERRLSAFWLHLGELFGNIAQQLLWIAAAILVVAALIYLRRFIPEPRVRDRSYRPPDALFGLEVAPQSLPGDIAGAAADLARHGRLREALSLLYRGALSALVHRHHLTLTSAHTEGDCVRAARVALPRSASDYFAMLVHAWQGAAYAARPPEPVSVEQLCSQWRGHFGDPLAS